MAKDLPVDLTMALAKQIRQMRLARQWSREDLAEHSQINIYTLKHFERCGQISLDRLLKICQALGILDELMRVFKPRQRIDVSQWAMPVEATPLRQRGRRRPRSKAIDSLAGSAQ